MKQNKQTTQRETKEVKSSAETRYEYEAPDFIHDLKSDKKNRIALWGMLAFGLICLVAMPLMSLKFGISGDEFIDDRHSTYVIDYFAGNSKEALDQPQTKLHLYGNEVQVVIKYLSNWLHVDDVYAFRHVCCALIGAFGIIIAGLFAFRLGGAWCGLIAMVLMFFTPRFFGHSMNNLKDIPFAVGYIASLYYFVRFFDFFPKFKIKYFIGVLAGIFLCLGARSGGLLLFPMMLLYAALYYLRRYRKNWWHVFDNRADIGRMLAIMAGIFVFGYAMSVVLWPWALQKPTTAIFESLKIFTKIDTGLKTIFEGKQMMSNMLPANYAPKFIMISTPLVTLAGFFGFVIYATAKRKFDILSVFLLFTCVFPVCYVVYKHSNLYGGIRHLLFVFPSMVILAAFFWSKLIVAHQKYVKWTAIVAFVALLMLPVRHYAMNHPYEYVYFNELAGGMKGTYGDYETDYYYNSLKEQADWIKRNADLSDTIVVATNHSNIMAHYFRKEPKVKIIYTRFYEKYSKNWDYAAFAAVYINRFQLQNGFFPPEDAVLVPKVDGKAIGCLLKRGDKSELEGFTLMKDKQASKAIPVFEEYLKKHPNNSEVWTELERAYYIIGNHEKVKECAEQSLKLYPTSSETLFFYGNSSLQTGDYENTRKCIKTMMDENNLSTDAHYLRAMYRYKMGMYKESFDDAEFVITRKSSNEEQTKVLIAKIFMACKQWDNAEAMCLEILTQNQQRIDVITLLADIYCFKNDYAKAEELLKKAMEIQSNYYGIYKVYARLELQRNQLGNANYLLNYLQEINSDAELFVIRSMFFDRVNQPDAAVKMIDEALKIEPHYFEAVEIKKRKDNAKKAMQPSQVTNSAFSF